MKAFVPKPGAAAKADPALCIKPLVSTTLDLSDFESMPFSIQMLTASTLALMETPEVFKATIMLIAKSWHQVPPGSLPNDELALGQLSGLGADFPKYKRKILKEWILCSDNRLYNYSVNKRVETALVAKKKQIIERDKWSYKKERSRRKIDALRELCLQYGIPFDASQNSIVYLTGLLTRGDVEFQRMLNEIDDCYKKEVEAEKKAKQQQRSLEMDFFTKGGEFASNEQELDDLSPGDDPSIAPSPLLTTPSDESSDESKQDRQPDEEGAPASAPSYILSDSSAHKDASFNALNGISKQAPVVAQPAQILVQSPQETELAAISATQESYKWGDRSNQESYKSPNEAVFEQESYKYQKTAKPESYKSEKQPVSEIENHKNAVSDKFIEQSGNFMILDGTLAEMTPLDGGFDAKEHFHKNTPETTNTHKTPISMIPKMTDIHKNTSETVVFDTKNDLSPETSPSFPRTNTYKTELSAEIKPSSEPTLSVNPTGKGTAPPSLQPSPTLSLDRARVGESLDVKNAKAGKEGGMGNRSVPEPEFLDLSSEPSASVGDAEPKRKSRKRKTGYDPFTYPVPSWMPLSHWHRYLHMRQSMEKKRISHPSVVTSLIEKLYNFSLEGYDLTKTLEMSIISGWVDVFKREENRTEKAPIQGSLVDPVKSAPSRVVPLDKSRLLPPGVLPEPPGLVPPSLQAGQRTMPAWAHALLEACEDDPARLPDLKRYIEVYAKDNRVPMGIALQRYPFVSRDKEVRVSLGSLAAADLAKKPPPADMPGAA